MRLLLVPLALALSGTLVGCGSTETDPRGAAPTSSTDTESDPKSDPEREAARETGATEADGPQPRLAVTYDGGVLVLDAAGGEVLTDVPLEGFTRLNPAGDERHLLVSAAGGFTALDLGAWTEEHGDHGHSWTTEPALTDVRFAAEEPGHAVVHGGTTTLFDDGTGTITVFDPDDLAEAAESATPVATETWQTPEAHHGVAALLPDGSLLHTVGDDDARSGITVLDPSGAEVAGNDGCPGVHGEAFARDVAVVGCEDGALVVDGAEITKVQSPDGYGRIGNQAGAAGSPYVLGDYKVDEDAELERPTRVSVIDTRDAGLRLVDLGTSYSFRSLGRADDGSGLVLGTDGALHVIDPRTATVGRTVPVVQPWEEPLDWQQPRPTLLVMGTTAYVTEPASRQVHVVDLDSGTVTASHDLPEVPNELSGIEG